jgi:parallel beta-helix repeat protein
MLNSSVVAETDVVGLKKALSILSILMLSSFLLTVNMRGALVLAEPDVIEVSAGGSIQAAINAADPGDTILVHSGTYDENITINKALSLVGENRDSTIIQGISSPQSLYVVTILGANVVLTNFTIKKSSMAEYTSGVLVVSGSNVISSNKIIGSYYGLRIYASSGNVISNNIISNNSAFGVYFDRSNGNFFSDNVVSDNREGIRLTTTSNNVLYENLILANDVGTNILSASSGNTLYHNNFLDAVKVSSSSINVWSHDNEGNYWVNYTGHDVNGDGIGEEPYTDIGGTNEDGYPLTGMFSKFSIVLREGTYISTTVCNSSISAFKFEVGAETGNRLLHFNVTDGGGSAGFCRIMIPTGLMDYPFIVIDGEEEITPTILGISNQSHAYLYFTYAHLSQTITIISSVTLRYYNDLLEKYLSLQSELDSVNATYYALLSNYSNSLQAAINNLNATYYALLNSYTSGLQSDINDLNSTYHDLMDNYNSLMQNYTRLQQDYLALNSSYREHLTDFSESMQNLRNIAYIFAATTAIFLATVVYLSKIMHSRKQSQD